VSGPIIRTYGVSNWDEIFGKKEPKQGSEAKADENAAAPPADGAKASEKPEDKKPG
jgi:hypothetical protein